jgi:hypothetical protein
MARVPDILLSGTRAAQPAAATANEGYFYRVTDEGNLLEQSTGAAWVAVSSGGVGPGGVTLEEVEALIAEASLGGAAQNTFLVTGGQVTWVANYEFSVSAATYYINGVLYSSAADTVTLDAADPTNDRLDIIALDDTGAVVKVTGTAAAQPSEPDIDLGTQIKLALVLVTAATTAPPAAVNEVVYADNAGSPAEWNWTVSGAGFDVNSTNNPRAPSTKDIEGTSVASGAYAQGEIGTGSLDPADYALLVLWIRSKASWNNNRGLQLSLRNAGVQVGAVVNIARSGTWGFDSTSTGAYQQVAIPMTQFAVPFGSTVTQLRITDYGGAIGFYIDDVSFQAGATTQDPTGLTLAQADTRYRRLAVPLTLSSAADVTGDLSLANLAPAAAASRLLGRGSAAGAGDWEALTLGAGLSLAGTVLSASGTGTIGGSTGATDEAVLVADGVGGSTLQATPVTINSSTGAVTFPDDVRQTFNPGANNAGLNVGSLAGDPATPSNGDIWYDSTANELTARINGANVALGSGGSANPVTVGVTVDGGGSVVTTGVKGAIRIPISGTITSWSLMADLAGDIEFDVTLDAPGTTYPPTTSIVAAAPPTMTGNDFATDSTLTGWTTAVTAGDVFGFTITGTPATIERVTLQIVVTP